MKNLKSLFISMMILLSSSIICSYSLSFKIENISECMCVEIEEIEKRIGKLSPENYSDFYDQYEDAIAQKFSLDRKSLKYPRLNTSCTEEGIIQDSAINVFTESAQELAALYKEVKTARELCKQRAQEDKIKAEVTKQEN